MRSSSFESNLAQLKTVAIALDDLLPDVVFVGGCTTALLVDKAATGSVRRTEDVDFIVDITTHSELYAFSEKLRERGFAEDDSEDAPICRWTLKGPPKVTVDVMPTDEKILGFSNRWYGEALQNPETYQIGEVTINVVTPALFIATKFEAFWGRGQGDFYCHDMEDIVFLLENRSRVAIEIMDEPDEIKQYISGQCKKIQTSEFFNVLPGLVDASSGEESVKSTLKLLSSF